MAFKKRALPPSLTRCSTSKLFLPLLFLAIFAFIFIISPSSPSSPFSFRIANNFFLTTPTYDIDIGTLGSPIGHDNKTILITFDPFDKPLITPNYERHPYIIHDFEGVANFTVNQDVPGCSSVNHRNWIVDKDLQLDVIRRHCGEDRVFENTPLEKCMYPENEKKIQVKTRKLSSFVKAKPIKKIGFLKVDAQGNDFAIVKDLFENTDDIGIEELQIECQKFNETVPLYFVSNDCGDIEDYIGQKKGSEVRKVTYSSNNCAASEFNVNFYFGDAGWRRYERKLKRKSGKT